MTILDFLDFLRFLELSYGSGLCTKHHNWKGMGLSVKRPNFFLFERNGYSLVNLHELFWKKDIHKKRTLPLVPSPSLKQMMVHYRPGFLSRPTSMWVLVVRLEVKLSVLRVLNMTAPGRQQISPYFFKSSKVEGCQDLTQCS